eukprot:s2698_g5.t2
MARLLGQRAHHEAVVSELGLETNLVLDRRQWQSGDDWSSITCKWVPSERKHYGVHATVPVEQGTCLAPPRAQVRIVPEELRAGPLFTAPVRIVPEELRAGPLFTAPVYQYSWGVQANRAASTAFTVFDHHRHVLVERCAPFASLQDIAALAINDAPFQVIAVKVLADPLPAYPTPQIVLSELGRPLDELPIPWDLRPIGEPVKTVRHLSRQDRQDALLDVQQLLTSPRNFAQEVAVGAIVVTDALGVLQPQLPANLHVVQHYRVAAMPVGEAPVPVAGEVAGPGATTATTTNTQIYAAAPQPPGICLAVLRGAVMHSIDVGARTGLLDAFLLQLLERHHDQSPISMPFQLVLASVQPPRQGYFQEAVGYFQEAVVLLIEGEQPIAQRAQLFLEQEWRDAGWGIAVNGIHDVHVARNLRNGDFIQPTQSGNVPAVTPLSWIIELMPQLQPLAWPLPCDGQLIDVWRHLRHRRQQLGFHHLDIGIVRIVGPLHGDVRASTGVHATPGIANLHATIARLAHFPAGLMYVATPIARENEAVFASSCLGSALNTVLVPAPGFPGHFLNMLASPAAAVLTAVPANALIAARVPPSLPDADSDEAEGHMLLQVRASRGASQGPQAEPLQRQGSVSVPTPFGRRLLGPDCIDVAQALPAPEGHKRTVLLEHCVAQSKATVPCEGLLSIGLPGDAQDVALDGFSLQNMRRTKPTGEWILRASSTFLDGLDSAGLHEKPSRLLMYVDGSFDSQQGAWAVCCLGYCQGQWKWIGFFADKICSKLKVQSAFDAELFSQFVALGVAARAGLPAAIFYDCQAAATVATGNAKSSAATALSRAAVGLLMYSGVRGQWPALHHVRSHQGDPLNELVDGLAKQALRGQAPIGELGDERICDYICQQAFEWLWIYEARAYSAIWPCFDPDGCSMPDTEPTRIRVELRAATYNTLSGRTALQRQCLTSFMKQHRIQVLGLQEARYEESPRAQVQGILRFSGPALNGNLGCHVWVDLASGPWVSSAFRRTFQDPRLLEVHARLGDQPLVIMSGHCPTAVAPEAERTRWWRMLRDRLFAVPAGHEPLLLLDANSRYSRPAGTEQPANCNAEALEELLQEFHLYRTRAFEEDGRPRVSWLPPAGSTAKGGCLDFVVCREHWCNQQLEQGLLSIDDLHSGIDHSPVVASFVVDLWRPPRQPARLDRAAMVTEQGREQLNHIFSTIPV